VPVANIEQGSNRRRDMLDVVVAALAPLEAVGNRVEIARGVGNVLLDTVALGYQVDMVGDERILTLAHAGQPCVDASAVRRVLRRGVPETRTAGGVSWAIVPISASGRLLGALSVAVDHERWRDCGGPPVDALSRMGRALGAALGDAEVHAQATHVSHKLQESLLPSELPTADWFDIAGRHVPGSAGLEVGGDWYDAQILEDGTLAMSVGDVAGHGVEAAARMGELRSATTALRMVRSGPDDLISVLHRLTSSMGYIATAICTRAHPRGHVAWASAGHLPPLLVRQGDGIEVLESRVSPPLGVGYRDEVPVGHHPVDIGETILLYTDGLVEHRREPIDTSLERLGNRIKGMRWDSATELIDQVVDGRDDDPDSTRDDVAVLAAIRLR
jgi:stage II sporulation SpoE-like protein